ncbi:MAG: AI-2E family transporter [Candidatus Baltobacteraceae bacterium]
MQAKDLRAQAPRRWSEELGGIVWLPRMIDKTRSAIAGTLGDYLYGQSPIDRGLLRALGVTHKDFTGIVRRSGGDDGKVLAALQARSEDSLRLARRWSENLSKRHGLLMYLIDLDDGYSGGPLQGFRSLVRGCARVWSRYLRYRTPAKASFVGLEVEAQRDAVRAAAARGAEEEPYQWLTERRLDFAWKLLFSVVLIALILGALLHFIERIGAIFVVIVGAIFFAYLVYPVVRWLNQRLPLIVAILMVYACIAALVVIGLMYLIPAIDNEVVNLSHDWPSIQGRIAAFVSDPNNKLLAHSPPFVRQQLARLPITVPLWVQKHGAAAFGNALSVLVGTAAFLGTCIAIPVLGAYLLNDSETIKRFFIGFIPPAHRDQTLDVLGELEQVIGGFIRGQLLVGASVGLLIGIGLLSVGEPYAIVIAALAAVLDFIPYIGPVIAAVPAITIALVSGGGPLLIKVAIVFVVANQLEGHVIAPNIVSRTIKLSPSAVLLAILIGGELYGVLGMFVAVPVAGVMRVFLLRLIPGSVSRDEAKPVLTKDAHERIEETSAP